MEKMERDRIDMGEDIENYAEPDLSPPKTCTKLFCFLVFQCCNVGGSRTSYWYFRRVLQWLI